MKRMYANEELVKLIQENAPEVEVDDALSNTSENPVQNKVIYDALEDKQDALPDTTGETGKFLKVGADGLEWAEGGGGKLYQHTLYFDYSVNYGLCCIVINQSPTPFTFDSFKTFLTENSYTSATSYYPCNSLMYYKSVASVSYLGSAVGLYVSASTLYGKGAMYNATVTDNKVIFNYNSDDKAINSSDFKLDKVVEIQ